MTIKEFCTKCNLTKSQFLGKEKIKGNLDLSSLTSIPAGFNPTVGGTLYLGSLKSSYIKLPENYIFTWNDGKYIKSDGIFTEVISKRGNVYHVKKVNSSKVTYLVTDGSKFSHGDTLKEAKESLKYKIGNRDKSRYSNLKKSSVLSLSEMIECYRVITGACEAGVRNFITSVGEVKDKYKISDIIKITKNQYGNNDFDKFFA